MLSDEEKIKIVEQKIGEYVPDGVAKVYFCKATDGRYAIATFLGDDEDEIMIRYFFFTLEELDKFVTDIRNTIDQDKKRRSN